MNKLETRKTYKFKTKNSHKYKFQLLEIHWLNIGLRKYPLLNRAGNNGELNHKYFIFANGKIFVYANYAWDGCTPKFRLGKLILGTWDGPNNAFAMASMYHDLLCQCNLSYPAQQEADKLFKELLIQSGCNKTLANIYWLGVSTWSRISK